MADDQLPEGTDKIINGASQPINSGAIGTASDIGAEDEVDGDVLLVADDDITSLADDRGTRVVDKLRSGRAELTGQAASKARGIVAQGLERGSEALANVGRIVGESADGLDERLGAEYGDYARRAASAIEGAADSLAGKDADELIDDTRDFVRKSPGVALAGAAVVGFALARLIKTGLSRGDEGRSNNTRRDA
jgi:ElaB/YqjD/DUF883 family membrane-anchored ribosome-binding protein